MLKVAPQTILRAVELDWILASNRMGHAIYRGATRVASTPFDFCASSVSQKIFKEPPKIPEERKVSTFLAKRQMKTISSTNELLQRIFNIAVSLAIFIPVTLVAKEVVIAAGFAELSMVATPLTTLLAQETAAILFWEILSNLMGGVGILLDSYVLPNVI